MYLITLRQMSEVEIPKMEYDHPLTFSKANDMLLEAVMKYKQTGQQIKLRYRIINIESGESIFNARFTISQDTDSLFQVIRGSNSIPKEVVDYVSGVESKSVEETEVDISFNNHVEEKAKLEQLKTEKSDIQQQLKNDEKERMQRDMEYQRKMKAIQDEKEALEKALQQKEKEEAFKESQRLEALRQLEEEKQEYQQRMEEKRAQDKRKQEEHEKRLKQVEDEAKVSEIELANIQAELDKGVLERKKELQELEEQKAEIERQANLLKAEGEVEEVQHKQRLQEHMPSQQPIPGSIDVPIHPPGVASASMKTAATVVPKLTMKERLQELDFEAVKNYSGQAIKFTAKASVKGSKRAYKLARDHRESRKAAKQEKQEQLSKKLDFEEKLTTEKIKFMDELKKDKLMQEKELKKQARQQAREAEKQVRIEERYRAEKTRKFRSPSLKPLKNVLALVLFVTLILGVVYYFDLGNGIPIVDSVKAQINGLVNQF
ncbi:hypothetical protein GZ22_18260 (plasmid) [Terribacillus saccharophilus]|uniref:Uncharacterized protein n=1 Tax=Terribacillus saccharophilus TaxID=361277 RepID=A0A075LQV5_9BACI|nr:hypothetical protein [Terribacillus goriensis]AIF68382.1 hypothetical protein GZ22_18260 [Terribacillus goriensis]